MNTIRENFVLTCITILRSNDGLAVAQAYHKLLNDYKNMIGNDIGQVGAKVSCLLDVINTMFVQDGENRTRTYTQDAYTYLQKFVAIVKAAGVQSSGWHDPKVSVSRKSRTLQGYLLYAIASTDCDLKNKFIIDIAKLAMHA